ncbi:hypothetical protein [Verrucomicrobium spinosum]|uniref:hypothetical protein n=1 Tax=Verrucomicrobium spinosum TaxID=2736 RepID=UPI0009462929|nr:hypothetical protein [Verrucomicrobium spinosum]
MIRPLSFFLALLLTLTAVSSVQAQVLIYKLDFRKDKGINYHPFTGGYFVAPLLGGSGTFFLTSTDDERVYVEAAEGGRLFTAISGGGDKKSVISASLGAGTAMGAWWPWGTSITPCRCADRPTLWMHGWPSPSPACL